tara:strand:+ start:140 stop:352 length:213 start_codon:yes stop_codon:yes gene_type:complete
MADWEEQNKRMTKTGEGEDEEAPTQALDEGDIALLQVSKTFKTIQKIKTTISFSFSSCFVPVFFFLIFFS